MDAQTFYLNLTTLHSLARAGGYTLTIGNSSSGDVLINAVDFTKGGDLMIDEGVGLLALGAPGSLTIITGGTINDTDTKGVGFASNGGTLTLTSGSDTATMTISPETGRVK